MHQQYDVTIPSTKRTRELCIYVSLGRHFTILYYHGVPSSGAKSAYINQQYNEKLAPVRRWQDTHSYTKRINKKKIYTLKSSRHYVIVEYGSFCLFWRRLCIHTLMVGMGERKFILSFRLFLSSYSRRDFPSSN